MIKKVSSWVLGSFFRQFGRFLFFLVLGGLVFLLIQHNDINFKWTDLLGIQTVKAMTMDGVFKGQVQTDSSAYDIVLSQASPVQSRTITFTNSINTGTSNYIVFPWKGSITIANTGITTYSSSQIVDNITKIQLMTNGVWPMCEIQNNLIVCAVAKNTTYTGIQVEFQIVLENDEYMSLNYQISNYASLYQNGNTALIESQENQTQQQAEQHNETMQFFNDSNTTTDVSNADSFFSDTNSTSESALADIVSTPLTLLNNLSTGTFNDICATLNNKQICLPSGDIIWNRQHGGAGVHDHWFRGGSTQAFITFFNLVVGGFILYKCLISLFHSVHKMLDPTQTYVEVMKL